MGPIPATSNALRPFGHYLHQRCVPVHDHRPRLAALRRTAYEQGIPGLGTCAAVIYGGALYGGTVGRALGALTLPIDLLVGTPAALQDPGKPPWWEKGALERPAMWLWQGGGAVGATAGYALGWLVGAALPFGRRAGERRRGYAAGGASLLATAVGSTLAAPVFALMRAGWVLSTVVQGVLYGAGMVCGTALGLGAGVLAGLYVGVLEAMYAEARRNGLPYAPI